MSAEATAPAVVIPAKAGIRSDALSRRPGEGRDPVPFPRYPKYKETRVTWLGEMPAGWNLTVGRRLFAQRRDGASEDDVQLSATQKYGVIPQTQFIETEDRKPTLALSGTANFKHVEVNDFVISLRSFQGGIEHSAFAGCVSPAYTVLRACSEIQPRFWAYLLKSDGYVSALQAVTEGIRDGKNISYEQFGQIPLPTPTLTEQIAIAAFLDRETAKIDALIAEQEKLITLLKEKRQALISHAVTKGLDPDAPMKDSGIEWLGQVPAHWDTTTIRRVALRVDTGGTPVGVAPSDQIEDPTPWFTPGDFPGLLNLAGSARAIPRSIVKDGEAKCFPPGSILIVSIGATLGKVGYAASECSANQQINAVVPANRLDGYFLTYSLTTQTDQMRFLSNASTIGIMNQEKTKGIMIAVPPREEQTEICRFLDGELKRHESLECAIGRAIALLKERRAALISAAVTGKICVLDS